MIQRILISRIIMNIDRDGFQGGDFRGEGVEEGIILLFSFVGVAHLGGRVRFVVVQVQVQVG